LKAILIKKHLKQKKFASPDYVEFFKQFMTIVSYDLFVLCGCLLLGFFWICA